jgi:Rrf2 family protein
MISRTGLHAVRAMTALARLPEGAYAGAAGIAREIGAPPNYLSKLLQGLVREGLVQSQKGSGGGFRLARDPGLISLLDVVQPIERVSRWSGCFLGRKDCSDADPCLLHDRWKRVRTAYLLMLSKTSLADLLEKGEPSLDMA